MPNAGRIRPKTIASGSFTTPSTSPVSTSTLSSTLVNNPKNAFQSPGTHKGTARPGRGATALLIIRYPPSGESRYWQHGQERFRWRDPAEDAALGFHHLERHLIEVGKVGRDAVRQHQTLEAAIVRFADGCL